MAHSWRETCRSTRTFPIPKQKKKTTRRPPRNSSVLSAPKDQVARFNQAFPTLLLPLLSCLSHASSGCESDPPRARGPDLLVPSLSAADLAFARSALSHPYTFFRNILDHGLPCDSQLGQPTIWKTRHMRQPVMHAARKAQGTDAAAIRL